MLGEEIEVTERKKVPHISPKSLWDALPVPYPRPCSTFQVGQTAIKAPSNQKVPLSLSCQPEVGRGCTAMLIRLFKVTLEWLSKELGWVSEVFPLNHLHSTSELVLVLDEARAQRPAGSINASANIPTNKSIRHFYWGTATTPGLSAIRHRGKTPLCFQPQEQS